MEWHLKDFGELTALELYRIVELRERVFIVEQACAYVDADGVDPQCRHLWMADASGELRAYCRVVPPRVKYPEVSIGRVIVTVSGRGQGLGYELMRRGIEACGSGPIRIGAQAHLERFYGNLGFVRASEPYLEDGIPHVEMLRAG